MGRLTGRVIGITGGGSGIGRACALAYAAEGAHVAVTDIGELGDPVAREIVASGGRAEAWFLDVTARETIPAVIEAIVASLGPLDVWHNNAGVSTMGRFVDLTEDDWDVNMDVNAKGVFNCSQVVARHMIEAGRGGKIVNTASMAGRQGGVAFLPHYVASKFAVVGLTQAMANELGPFGITVNAICPGYVVTPMQDREAVWEAQLRGIEPDAVRQLYVAETPLGRLQTPQDVARVAVFLASSDSDFITGASIDVNGGAWMG
ncbi:MAG TPA: SDR family oxidoreductase [Candidatus Limnocylindrales bacterium]|nr:SDR family oxidoreductase [Candidatus Limnocylindrales bacterium]